MSTCPGVDSVGEVALAVNLFNAIQAVNSRKYGMPTASSVVR